MWVLVEGELGVEGGKDGGGGRDREQRKRGGRRGIREGRVGKEKREK